MSSLKTRRTKESYRKKIESREVGTQRNILQSIDNFETYCMEVHGKANMIPDLRDLELEELYDVMQDWINWNNDRAASTVRIYFSNVKKYLHYMRIKMYKEDIDNELEFKSLTNEELYGLSVDNIQSLFKVMNFYYRTLFTCQLSALMQIGEIVQLRKKHLVLGKENIIVKIPSHIAKFKKGRTTFFSNLIGCLINENVVTTLIYDVFNFCICLADVELRE